MIISAPKEIFTSKIQTASHSLEFVAGFLQFEDPSLEVPGNAGLKDIVQALGWVKSNIKSFQGDPDNVTIFGVSAGSAAVQYLLLSPTSKGLFHKAILQSGSAFNPWARGEQKNELLAQALGLATANERQILEALQELPVEKVLEVQRKIQNVSEKRNCVGDHKISFGRRRFSMLEKDRHSQSATTSLTPFSPRKRNGCFKREGTIMCQ